MNTTELSRTIAALIDYAQGAGLIGPEDRTWAVNQLLAVLELDAYDEPEEADASLLASLDPLTGLRSVKEKLTVYERVVRFNRMRARKGLPVPPFPLHAMFLGSPGTGRSSSSWSRMLHQALSVVGTSHSRCMRGPLPLCRLYSMLLA